MNWRKSMFIMLALVLGTAVPVLSQMAPAARTSPHETVSAVIGDRRTGNRVTITYGRPYSKAPATGEKRKIWALVPWGKVWRLGSDEATTLITQQPIMMGDVTIPAGAYTLAMLPMEEGASKLIVNKAVGQWGVPYTPDLEKQELARIDIPRKESMEKEADQLTIAVENVPAGGGVIKISWETTQFSMPFTVKKP